MTTTSGRIWIVQAVALGIFLPNAAGAQRVPPGLRIRVTVPELNLRQQPGQLVWLDQDSLIVGGAKQRWVVPRQLLTQIEASRGRRRHVLAGMLVGAGVGAVTGLILISPEGTCTGSGNYGEVCA